MSKIRFVEDDDELLYSDSDGGILDAIDDDFSDAICGEKSFTEEVGFADEDGETFGDDFVNDKSSLKHSGDGDLTGHELMSFSYIVTRW